MAVEGIPNLVGRVGPLDTAVEAFGVLAENDRVDLGLFGAAIGAAANEIERVAGKRDTRPDRHVEVESLAQTNNRRVINVALVAQFRFDFSRRLVLRFGRDGAKQRDLVLGDQLHGFFR
jgi:hypothetical protein